MPLVCLDKVGNPYFYREVIDLHCKYYSKRNPDVGANYVKTLLATNKPEGAPRSTKQPFANGKSAADYLKENLSTTDFMSFAQIAQGFEGEKRRQLTTMITSMWKRGEIEKIGGHRTKKYRLIT